MAGGLAWFATTRARLDGAGQLPAAHPRGETGRARDARRVLGCLAVVALLAGLYAGGVTGLGAVQLRGAAIWVIVTLVFGFFAYLLWGAQLSADERRRVGVLVVLFVASTVFWSGFEQAGSSMTLFAERYTRRLIGGLQVPAGWFQMLNSGFIILFAPVFSALWSQLGRRGTDLSTGLKFVLGLLGMAAGFVVMAAAARGVVAGGRAGPGWLAAAYLLHTWGELALSPVGMSATTQLVPARFTGQSLGLWYASLSLGSLLASLIAGDFDDSNIAAMPAQYLRIVVYGVVAALALAALLPFLRRASAPAR